MSRSSPDARALIAEAAAGRCPWPVVAGDVFGRLLGGLVIGFCIGVMVVVAETAFRRAWLEVRYGGREVITVNLGPEPVKVGGDAKACTVWARGAAPVALSFFIRDGEVICDDRGAGASRLPGTVSPARSEPLQ